jgi:hypothetical protein
MEGRVMKSRVVILTGVLVATGLIIAPAQGWQASPDGHAQHHPAAQADKPSNAKLDELVAKMNAAKGDAKVDAIAELLTALVQQHQGMHGNMSQMMSKMKGVGAAK